jgi:hypothetical protein
MVAAWHVAGPTDSVAGGAVIVVMMASLESTHTITPMVGRVMRVSCGGKSAAKVAWPKLGSLYRRCRGVAVPAKV